MKPSLFTYSAFGRGLKASKVSIRKRSPVGQSSPPLGDPMPRHQSESSAPSVSVPASDTITVASSRDDEDDGQSSLGDPMPTAGHHDQSENSAPPVPVPASDTIPDWSQEVQMHNDHPDGEASRAGHAIAGPLTVASSGDDEDGDSDEGTFRRAPGCTGTRPHSVAEEGHDHHDGSASPGRRARFRGASHPLLRYLAATDDERREMLDAWRENGKPS